MNNNNDNTNSTEIAVMENYSLKDKVYIVRGIQVMLDFELADIYGYTTKAFNQQVKNNIQKFPDDFRFQLSKEEWSDLRSKFLTSNRDGRRNIPFVFTAHGTYMLISVLRGKTIRFIKSDNKSHDRYIILDNGIKATNVYHCILYLEIVIFKLQPGGCLSSWKLQRKPKRFAFFVSR